MKKVKFKGCDHDQAVWRGCDDPNGKLIVGQDYEVEWEHIHAWHTRIKLKGIEGEFNSVCFEGIENMLDLKREKEICDAATPGPWDASDMVNDDGCVVVTDGERVLFETNSPNRQSWNDCCFVANARTVVPLMIQKIKGLQDRIKELEQKKTPGS